MCEGLCRAPSPRFQQGSTSVLVEEGKEENIRQQYHFIVNNSRSPFNIWLSSALGKNGYPPSTLASLITIAQVGGTIISYCNDYHRTFSSVPRDLTRVFNDKVTGL